MVVGGHGMHSRRGSTAVRPPSRRHHRMPEDEAAREQERDDWEIETERERWAEPGVRIEIRQRERRRDDAGGPMICQHLIQLIALQLAYLGDPHHLRSPSSTSKGG